VNADLRQLSTRLQGNSDDMLGASVHDDGLRDLMGGPSDVYMILRVD
jgi:hypothetical protein